MAVFGGTSLIALANAAEGLGSSRAKALAFTSIGHFVNDGSVFFLPVVGDLLAATRGFSPFEVALLLFTFYAIASLSSVFVGREADRSGRAGTMMSAGMVLLGLGLVGFYFTILDATGPDLLALSLAMSMLMGFGSAFYHPLGATILQDSFGNSSGGRALGVNGSIGSIGRALYPSLFFVIAAVFTRPESVAFLGVIGMAAACVMWAGLRGFTTPRSKGSGGRGLRKVLTPTMVAVTALSFLRSATMFGVAAFIPEYLTFQRGVGVSAELGFTLSAMFVAAIFGQPFFGYLMDRFDKRVIFMVSSVGAALSIFAYTIVGGTLGIPLLVSFGFFTYTGFPILLSLTTDYTPEGTAAMGNAVVWGLGASAGQAVSPLVIGTIVMGDYGRLDFAFQLMVLVAIASAFFILLMPKRKRRTSGLSPD